jgi:enamine deaminase RidA (YjgF/YER057c/UK114 family)
MRKLLFAFLCCLANLLTTEALAQAAKPKPQKEFNNPEGLPKSSGYTQVVTVRGGRTVYISGQVAFNAKGELVGASDLRAQLVQVFQNLKTALAAAGATTADVVKLNYYVVGYKPSQIVLIREVRDQFFPSQNRPASTLAGVESLFQDGILVEVEAIAVTD